MWLTETSITLDFFFLQQKYDISWTSLDISLCLCLLVEPQNADQ